MILLIFQVEYCNVSEILYQMSDIDNIYNINWLKIDL